MVENYLSQVGLGEDEADIADQVIQQGRPLVISGFLTVEADGPLHHGVLAHQHNAVAHIAQTLWIVAIKYEHVCIVSVQTLHAYQ